MDARIRILKDAPQKCKRNPRPARRPESARSKTKYPELVPCARACLRRNAGTWPAGVRPTIRSATHSASRAIRTMCARPTFLVFEPNLRTTPGSRLSAKNLLPSPWHCQNSVLLPLETSPALHPPEASLEIGVGKSGDKRGNGRKRRCAPAPPPSFLTLAVAMPAALFKNVWLFMCQHHESARLLCGTANAASHKSMKGYNSTQ